MQTSVWIQLKKLSLLTAIITWCELSIFKLKKSYKKLNSMLNFILMIWFTLEMENSSQPDSQTEWLKFIQLKLWKRPILTETTPCLWEKFNGIEMLKPYKLFQLTRIKILLSSITFSIKWLVISNKLVKILFKLQKEPIW